MEPASPDQRITIEVVPVRPQDQRDEAAELLAYLTATPRQLPAKYFYDERGSRLFECITELPEYYQTHTERALLADIADRLVARTEARELVELGAGAATKTRVLLDAMSRAGTLRRYVPLDVDEQILRRVAAELVEEYPGLEVWALVGDFTQHLGHLPTGDHHLALFLGGTIGNLRPEPDAVAFLRHLADELQEGDYFLLGTDLIKDPMVLEAAYNDAAGVTAEFNRNILRVINARFDADFDESRYRHRAIWSPEKRRIEMWLDSLADQHVRIGAAGLELDLEAGEGIRTEISTTYDRPAVEGLLAAGGFELAGWYTDEHELFALSLARRR
jgi:L-histidine N-alpha-methyltransferase